MGEDYVSRDEFAMYVKGVNGDSEDIKKSIVTLTDNMNRRFDTLDMKFEQERKDGHDAHLRIHKRIDSTNKAVGKVKEGHMSQATAYIIVALTALAVAGATAFTTLLIAR